MLGVSDKRAPAESGEAGRRERRNTVLVMAERNPLPRQTREGGCAGRASWRRTGACTGRWVRRGVHPRLAVAEILRASGATCLRFRGTPGNGKGS